MKKPIQRFEYDRLIIGEQEFEKKHWDACVKLNTLHEGKYFAVLYNGIRFKQYVGVLQIGDITIEILPKADKDEVANGAKKWRNVLLGMLKACKRLKADTYDTANVSKQNLNLLDIYFELFLKEIETLQHQGLIKQYRKNTANVKALKGKLEFAQQIRHNLVHKERFYTTHQVYDVDHQLHQILAEALAVVGQFTKGTRLSNLWSRVNMSFPEVSKVKITPALLNNFKFNRKAAPYTYAFELARLILLNYSPDIKGGKEKMLSLLFDMNQLWEEYVLVKLKQWNSANNLGFTIKGQARKNFITSRYMKPDIVLEKEGKTYVIDTKWKRPYGSASIEDLRQVYTYARFWQADKVMLLYPGEISNSTKFVRYANQEHDGQKHLCRLGSVSVLASDSEKLNELLGEAVFGLLEID